MSIICLFSFYFANCGLKNVHIVENKLYAMCYPDNRLCLVKLY